MSQLAGIEGMVGLLITTLPVHAEVGGERPVGEMLAGLQDQMVESQRYGYAPLTEMQAQSAVGAGEPLFHSLIVFENYPVEESGVPGWELTLAGASGEDKTNYPLVLVSLPGDRLRVRLEYDTRLFEAGTIQRMAGHLEVLLRAMAAVPEVRVRELPLLSEAERERLERWGGEELAHPGRPVHEQFEERAARRPDAEAVICG